MNRARGIVAVRLEDGGEFYAIAEQVTVTLNEERRDVAASLLDSPIPAGPERTDIVVEGLRVLRWFVRMPTADDLRREGLVLPPERKVFLPEGQRRLSP